MIAFCGLFLSSDERSGVGETEPDETGIGETVVTGGDGAGVGDDPAGVGDAVTVLLEYTTD